MTILKITETYLDYSWSAEWYKIENLMSTLDKGIQAQLEEQIINGYSMPYFASLPNYSIVIDEAENN